MGATAVEHETEEKIPTRAAESPLKDGTAPVAVPIAGEQVAELAAPAAAAGPARPAEALFNPRLLLGLQARAGNAAVAGLIEERRKPEPTPAAQPASPSAPIGVGESPLPADAASPAALATEAEPGTESATAPRPGETDDALAELDAAADAPASVGEVEPRETQDIVARDAQAELADEEASPGAEPSETPGGAEPGVPIEARPPPSIPDVSTAEPSAGLARVGGLPPAQLLGSLGSVASAVDRDVSLAHARLATDPPQRPRHPGAPSTVDTPASTRIQLTDRPASNIARVPEGRDVDLPRPAALPVLPQAAAPNGQLPTHDPGLELKPGPLPQLPLSGNADSAVVQQQHSHVLRGLETEHARGRQDAAQPLGEDELYPMAPAETLRAAVGQAPGANGHQAAPPASSGDDEAASILAQQEKGGEIQGAISGGLAGLAAERQEHEQRISTERAKANAEMAQLEQTSTAEQAGERTTAKRDVVGLRKEWTGAQQELVAGAQQEADAKSAETLQTVSQERGAAEQQAAAHYQEGQREADRARLEGEQQAAAERKKVQGQDSGGVLGAIGSAVGSLFDKAKQAVQGVFDKARQLVRGAIERAQQLATAVMERARQAIVGAIRLAGSALVAIGDRFLVAFPKLRDRFRKAIQDRIAAAEAVVNKLANVLRQAVQTALNLLGTALSAAIGFLHQGMQAALDSVRATVRSALDFARNALAAFGTFAVLVKDIAANPGRWISNLAAAVKDGLQNYLWVEIKTAVQGWFSDKVQEVVGVGQAIWHLLQRGGISIVEIGRMVWEGLKAAIPGILIALLIEKLMSLIVPAVGAILTIIQSIQAAWGSLGRILQAFETFFAFLKQVKLGNAGPQFAKAVAAGAIAAVEFVSNFLLTRLKGAASSVSNRLRALARRIGERLAGIGRRIVKGARAVGSAFRRAGQRVRAGFDRLRGKRPKSHADQERAKHEREQAAFSATKAKLDALFAKGVSRGRLASEVARLKLRYRWGSLRVQGPTEARHVAVAGGFSPERTVTAGQVTHEAETLEQMISRFPRAKRKLQQVRDDPAIDGRLKVGWMRAVENRLRKAARLEEPVNPYSVMVDVAASNRANFFLGDRIEVQEIVEAEGLLKYVDARDAFTLLKPELIVEYGYPIRWVRKIAAQTGSISMNDFAADAKVPGHFWSAFRDAVGAGELALKHMRLEPKDYPKGAISFVLPKENAAIPELHKPTAFDGMFFPKWAAAESSLTWGVVPPHEATKAGIREGVSKTFVPISSTILHEYVPPGVHP